MNQRPTGGKGLATLRVSDGKQDLLEQRKVIQKWLADYGLDVEEWYQDVGSRLEAYKRPAFQALLKRVTRGDIQWVVCEALDRFGVRSQAELGRFVCHLQDFGVKLYAIAEGLEVTSDDAFTVLSTSIGTLRSADELRSRAHRALKGAAKAFREGEFAGGLIPYAFDLACHDRLGVEAWRLVVYPDHKLQVWSDGRRTRFEEGTPRKNLGEKLRLVPSVEADRIEWVRKVFEWFVTEDLPFRAIATRLNVLGVSAINETGWSGARVGDVLKNPLYATGATVGNKRGHGKVMGLVGGKEQPVERVAGRTGRVVKRDSTDYIYPAGEYPAIIEREVWQASQDKLEAKGSGKRAKAPRNPDKWLAGLLVCGACGCKMAGFNRSSCRAKEPHNYVCSHHKTYPATSPCRLNKVGHGLLERLIDRYLAEAGVKLDVIARTEDPAGTLRALQLEGWSRQREYLGTLAEMVEVLHAAGIETGVEIDGQHYDTCDTRREYRKLQEARREELARLIEQKQEELRGFIRNIPRLTSELAIKLAEEEVERLGTEIAALQRQAQPLDERADELRAALAVTQERFRLAREALSGGGPLARSEAVRKVIRRVVLHFEAVESPGPNEPSSRLVRVVVEPLEGDEAVVLDESVACRSSVRHHFLRRVFTREEMVA